MSWEGDKGARGCKSMVSEIRIHIEHCEHDCACCWYLKTINVRSNLYFCDLFKINLDVVDSYPQRCFMCMDRARRVSS